MSDNTSDVQFRELVTEELKKISSKQDQNNKDLNKIDRKLDLHTQKMEYEIEKIQDLDMRQNASLDEHMKRSDALEKNLNIYQNESNKRISKIEIPTKILAYVGIPLGVLTTVLGILIKLGII